MENKWQERRSKFNHDDFKTKYLNALESFTIRIKDNDPGSLLILKEFIELDFPSWKELSKDAWWLAQNFEKEMSPICYFENPPLCYCNNKTKNWLLPLVHEMWMGRLGVKKQIERVVKLIRLIDEIFKELSATITIQNADYLHDLKKDLPQWEHFFKICSELSHCFSKFPRNIEVF